MGVVEGGWDVGSVKRSVRSIDADGREKGGGIGGMGNRIGDVEGEISAFIVG